MFFTAMTFCSFGGIEFNGIAFNIIAFNSLSVNSSECVSLNNQKCKNKIRNNQC